MIMADVLTWTLLIAAAYAVLIAYWLASVALFPALVEGCRERYGRRPVLATLIGAAVLLPVLVLGAVLARAVPAAWLLLGVLLLPALLAFAGSAGLALRIGAGLAAPVDAQQPWRRVVRGGGVLALVFLLPFLGWFVLLPWALVSGTGAAVMTLWAGARTPAADAPA